MRYQEPQVLVQSELEVAPAVLNVVVSVWSCGSQAWPALSRRAAGFG